MHYLDILLLAFVAVFILLRLRNMLGRRTGYERPPEQRRPAPMHTPTSPDLRPDPSKDKDRATVVQFPDRRSEIRINAAPEAEAGLAAIVANDRNFDASEFLVGARMAYEMIVEAFGRGDKEALRPLLAPEVYKDFATAIDARTAAGERQETALVAIETARIHEASLKGRMAEIAVAFTARLLSVTKNQDGAVIDGQPGVEQTVREIWSFTREVGSNDPTWQLIGTEAQD